MKIPKIYKEKKDFEKGFSDYYQRNIVPLCEKDIEQDRRQFISLRKRNVPIAIILATILSAGSIFIKIKFFLSVNLGRRGLGNLIVLIYIVIWDLLVGRYKRNYIKISKDKLIPAILGFFGEFSYKQTVRFDSKILTKHLNLKRFAINKSEDRVITKNGKYKIEATEISVVKSKDKPIFQGLAIIIKNLPKAEGKIVIGPKAKKNIFDYFYCDDQFEQFLSGDARFDQEFDIKYQDEKMLKFCDQELCDKLMNLNNVFNSSGLRFSYVQDDILILIPCSENLFEPDLDYPTTNEMSIRHLIKEILVIKDVINFVLLKFEKKS